ncbi:hypothetical protein NDU88_005781 [Pleurodeles waltl]|uniref:Uncharacterized protein n=1 Tax=Pleurodeles waltl TaxID=8319 RepID=A0AAV7LM39_PLEWA|nr:hypothetical protein NDU88_005781 [Pleurodeles waltl]
MICPEQRKENKNVTGTAPARRARKSRRTTLGRIWRRRASCFKKVRPASLSGELPGRVRCPVDPCRGPRARKELKIASPPALV